MKGNKSLLISDIVNDFPYMFDNMTVNNNKIVCTSVFNRSEKTPSMHLNTDNNLFYCFSTNKGGNARKLLQVILDEYSEEYKYLESKGVVTQTNEIEQLYNNDEMKAIFIYSEIEEYANYSLVHEQANEKARDYLINKRNLTKDIIDEYRIGFINNSEKLMAFLFKNDHFDLSYLEEIGVCKNGRFVMENRILFPIIDSNNFTISFQSRSIDENGIKYIKLSNLRKSVYPNLQTERTFYRGKRTDAAIRVKSEIIFVEGPFDALRLASHGIYNAYGLLTSGLSDLQSNYIARINNVNRYRMILMIDNDSNHLNNTINIAKKLVSTGSLNIVQFSYQNELKDPDEYFNNFQSPVYLHIIENLVNLEYEMMSIFLSTFISDNSVSTNDFYTNIKGFIRRYPEFIKEIENDVMNKRPNDLDNIMYLLSKENSRKSIGVHFLSKEMNLEITYAEKIFEDISRLEEIAKKIQAIEEKVADFIIDRFVRQGIKDDKFESGDIKRTSLSKTYNVIQKYGRSRIRVEKENTIYFLVEFDYLNGEISVQRRYRNLRHVNSSHSNNKSLFIFLKDDLQCENEQVTDKIFSQIEKIIDEIEGN